MKHIADRPGWHSDVCEACGREYEFYFPGLIHSMHPWCDYPECVEKRAAENAEREKMREAKHGPRKTIVSDEMMRLMTASSSGMSFHESYREYREFTAKHPISSVTGFDWGLK